MTNEVAFALFFGLFGYKVAFTYYAAGIIIGLLVGVLIGILRLEKYFTPFIYEEGAALFNHKETKSFWILINDAKKCSNYY